MTAILSAQMMASLTSLTSINTDVGVAQGRLNSGLKVASALDNAAVYFKAKGLTDKSNAYDLVNSNIKQSIDNIGVANRGIDTMYSNLDGLLTQLKDASSKSVGTLALTTTAGSEVYSGAGPAASEGQLVTSKVDGAGFTDTSRFQVGDVFAVSIINAANGSQTTRYFKASGSASTATTFATDAGTTTTSAALFTTAADLAQQFTRLFGTDAYSLTQDSTGKLILKQSAGSPSTNTIGFAQVTNSATGLPTGVSNMTIDFSRVFGTPVASTGGTMRSISDPALTVPGTTTAVLGTQVTYSASGATISAANSETRQQAADTYRATLLQLNNIAKDAYMPGYESLLTGKLMKVDMNDDVGDVVQNVKVGAVDTWSLGFTLFDSTTGNDDSSTSNFQDDTNIGTAITRVTTAMKTLRLRQNQLASFNTMMSSRMTYNQDFQKTITATANTITAADSAEEASNLASLQNRQSFATNNLSITKNAEANLLQILR